MNLRKLLGKTVISFLPESVLALLKAVCRSILEGFHDTEDKVCDIQPSEFGEQPTWSHLEETSACKGQNELGEW
jgi:hypothetical protein